MHARQRSKRHHAIRNDRPSRDTIRHIPGVSFRQGEDIGNDDSHLRGRSDWLGFATVTSQILASTDFSLAGAVARKKAGHDIGEALGLGHAGILIADSVEQALHAPTDILIDYTRHDAVKEHVLAALAQGVRVVIERLD